jgi:hypothetical protein
MPNNLTCFSSSFDAQAQVNRLKEEKAVKAEVQKWRSEGRKEITERRKEEEKRLAVDSIDAYKAKTVQIAHVRKSQRLDIITIIVNLREETAITHLLLQTSCYLCLQLLSSHSNVSHRSCCSFFTRVCGAATDVCVYNASLYLQRREQKAAEEKATRHQRNVHRIEGLRLAKEHHAELELKAKEAAHQATYSGLMNPFDWDLGQQSVQMRIGGSGVTHANPSSPAHNPMMRNGGGEIQPFA